MGRSDQHRSMDGSVGEVKLEGEAGHDNLDKAHHITNYPGDTRFGFKFEKSKCTKLG